MENTDDKSFVSHNSNKPFIRTMEDDLKKIKNSPARNNGAASAISSLASVSSQANVSRKEIKRPTPDPTSFPASISAPVSSVPKNLPVDTPAAGKENPKAEVMAEILKPIEKLKDVIGSKTPISQVLDRSNLFETGLVNEKKSAAAGEEKIASVSKPIIPASSANAFFRKSQSMGKLAEEIENLSPEARLARQSSLGNSDSEYKESLIIPPPARIFSAAPGQSRKFAGSFNPTSSIPPSLESKKRSIEEIIKEDSPNSFLRKFVKLFFAVLIIAGAGAGVYYFYIINKPIDNSLSINADSEVFVADVAEADIKADLNTDLNNEIKLYFFAARPSGIYRIILKDKDGRQSLGLENFRKSLNIIVPDSIANVLEKDYNLIAFNYPEKNYLRLGLVLKPKKLFDISVFARSWESDMRKSTEAMFMGDSGIYDPEKQFNSNRHNNFDIRYLPLGVENIALNYAIDDEKKFLLIATSKQDIFNLIDKIIRKN
ncbi:MAG: hypothetical protein V1732_05050 [Patescibacteria group bacterium]